VGVPLGLPPIRVLLCKSQDVLVFTSHLREILWLSPCSLGARPTTIIGKGLFEAKVLHGSRFGGLLPVLTDLAFDLHTGGNMPHLSTLVACSTFEFALISAVLPMPTSVTVLSRCA